jgi:hypothetical protein
MSIVIVLLFLILLCVMPRWVWSVIFVLVLIGWFSGGDTGTRSPPPSHHAGEFGDGSSFHTRVGPGYHEHIESNGKVILQLDDGCHWDDFNDKHNLKTHCDNDGWQE